MKPDPAVVRARRGFSLIELIVAVAIMAVLVGAAVPITSKVLSSKARTATRQELQVLADAAVEHFRDTWRLPDSLGALLVDEGLSGWSGPYLPGVVTDHVSGTSGYEVDAWSRAYTISVSGDVVTIRSLGEDALRDTSDDIAISSNVTLVRREHTLLELRTINQAIAHYNSLYQLTAPLSAAWSTAFSTLVTAGLLPNDSNYLTDGWNQPYRSVGGASPLVAVESRSIGTSGGGDGNRGGDDGKKGGGNGKKGGDDGKKGGDGGKKGGDGGKKGGGQ